MKQYKYISRNEVQPGIFDKYKIMDKETNQLIEVSKEELKDAIANNKAIVDGVRLTKNNRLEIIRSEKQSDGIIEEYYKACKIFGIEPLNIIKDPNGRYIATSLPPTGANIIIPPFISGIRAVNRQGQSVEIVNQVNHNEEIRVMLNTIAQMVYDKDTKKSAIDMLKLTDKKVSEIKGDIYRNESKIDDYGTRLQNNIDELNTIIEETKSEELKEIKEFIENNKTQMEEAVNTLLPKVDEISKSFDTRINDNIKEADIKQTEIRTKEEFSKLSKFGDYDELIKLIPYVEYIKLLIKPTREEIESWDEAVKNNVEYMGSGLDSMREKISSLAKSPMAIAIGLASIGAGIIPAVAILEATTGMYSLHQYNKANKRMVKLTKEIYKTPELIEDKIICKTDKDLATLFLEYQNHKHKFSQKRFDSTKRHREMIWFLSTIENNLNVTLKKPSEEELNIIIASYIVAYKIIFDEISIITDSGVEIKKMDAIIEARQPLEKQHKRDIYMTIIFDIMRQFMIMQNMSEKYIDGIYFKDTFMNSGLNIIYENLNKVDYIDEAGIKRGTHNMKFDMQKYAETMHLRNKMSTLVNNMISM